MIAHAVRHGSAGVEGRGVLELAGPGLDGFGGGALVVEDVDVDDDGEGDGGGWQRQQNAYKSKMRRMVGKIELHMRDEAQHRLAILILASWCFGPWWW